MIKTSRQLKDKIRNLSDGNSDKALSLFRTYMMERFLERVSVSEYRNNFILKGGLLVSSLVGANLRATMDIDTTIRALPINETDARRIIETITSINLDDNVRFEIVKSSVIMEDFDYPGIRFMIDCYLDNSKQTIKIDVSTNDIITPDAIEYSYKLMFEDRSIPLMSYNIETLLAEKLETIISRGVENTRMRDFYDIALITETSKYDTDTLKSAFSATVSKRETIKQAESSVKIISEISSNSEMEKLWHTFGKSNWFVENLSWNEVCRSVQELAKAICT